MLCKANKQVVNSKANAIMSTKARIFLSFFYDHDLSRRDIPLCGDGTRQSGRYNKVQNIVLCRDGNLIVKVFRNLGLQSGKLFVGLVIFTVTIISLNLTEFVDHPT